MFILVDLTYWLRAYQYRYLDVLRTENNWAKFMWRYDLVWEPGFAWKPNFSHKSPPIFSNIKLKNIPVGLPSFPIKFEAKRSRGSWVMINKQRLLLYIYIHIYKYELVLPHYNIESDIIYFVKSSEAFMSLKWVQFIISCLLLILSKCTHFI